jgi:hypothetical protein
MNLINYIGNHINFSLTILLKCNTIYLMNMQQVKQHKFLFVFTSIFLNGVFTFSSFNLVINKLQIIPTG